MRYLKGSDVSNEVAKHMSDVTSLTLPSAGVALKRLEVMLRCEG